MLGLAAAWPSVLSSVLAAWACTAAVFVAWTWAAIATMDAEETRGHATWEEPTRPGSEVVLVVAAVLSLGGVAGILFGGHSHEALPMVATFAAVLTSWAAIHTVFALRYARLYFADDVGGIDFHQAEAPRYGDFAYLAFAVGMSFAISDTELASWRMRRHALRHALLAYLFGTVIIAPIINITAGAQDRSTPGRRRRPRRGVDHRAHRTISGWNAGRAARAASVSRPKAPVPVDPFGLTAALAMDAVAVVLVVVGMVAFQPRGLVGG